MTGYYRYYQSNCCYARLSCALQPGAVSQCAKCVTLYKHVCARIHAFISRHYCTCRAAQYGVLYRGSPTAAIPVQFYEPRARVRLAAFLTGTLPVVRQASCPGVAPRALRETVREDMYICVYRRLGNRRMYVAPFFYA